MIRQNILYILIAAWLTGILAGCESFQEADKADDIAPLAVEINIASEVYETSGEGLTLTLTEINKGTVIEKAVTGLTMSVDNILPGIYNLSVSVLLKMPKEIIYTLTASTPITRSSRTIKRLKWI